VTTFEISLGDFASEVEDIAERCAGKNKGVEREDRVVEPFFYVLDFPAYELGT
jgi:hypothetical protein